MDNKQGKESISPLVYKSSSIRWLTIEIRPDCTNHLRREIVRSSLSLRDQYKNYCDIPVYSRLSIVYFDGVDGSKSATASDVLTGFSCLKFKISAQS